MTQDLRIALTTSLNDKLVGPLRRALDEVEKNLRTIEKDLALVNQGSNQANKTMASMQGPAQAARQAGELARNTQNAVNLADRLRSAWSVAGNTIKGVTSAVAAFQAAKYVIGGPLQAARSYDRQLRDLGNTAYGDLSGGQFTGKVKGLNTIIENALITGGGTREGAVGAASTLMAQGGLNETQLADVMPTILKAATAANSDPKDIANVVAASIKNGFNVNDIPVVIGKAIASGQAGGFEMKDMAKWLPKLLAAGSSIGMTGMRDYEEILALAQVSRTSAGGSDDAGNNLLNFLLKVNSHDTQMDAQKRGVDLSGTLAMNRGNGMTAASSFLALLQRDMDKDPRIVKLRQQYASAGNDSDRVASLKAQEMIFSGSTMGKWLQDRQALMPAIAALNNPEELQRQLKAARAGGTSTLDRAFGNIAAGSDFQVQQYENQKLFALNEGLGGVNSGLAKMAGVATELYRKYPDYAAVVQTAMLAIGGMAAAAAAAGGVLGLFSLAKGAVPGAVATGALPGVVGGGVVTGGLTAFTGVGLLTGGAVLGAGMLMSEAMNSEGGLRTRIDSRQARLSELTELAALEGNGGSAASKERLDREIAQIREDRDNLLVRLVSMDEVARELRALQNRPVQLVVDGSVLATSLNKTNERSARRN